MTIYETHVYAYLVLGRLIIIYLQCLFLDYYMSYLIHAATVHPSLCLQCFNPTVYFNHYCCHYSAATTAIKLLLLIICVKQDYLQVQVN